MKNSDKTTRIAYVIEAGFEYFVSLFVTGTMLGYLLDALGFSDAQQGIIATLASFTCGAQLFALALSGRQKKRIATVGHIVNQGCFVILYLLPIFNLAPALKTVLLIVFLFLGHLLNNAINPTKIAWLMESVPDGSRGSFTAVKELVSLMGGIVVSLVFGRVADIFRDGNGMPTRSYYVICAIALLLMTLIHTATLVVCKEKTTVAAARVPIRKSVILLVRNKNLLKVMGVGIIWNVASALSASFYASYLREELAFSFTLIATLTTVGSICRIAASPLLGRFADKHSFATSMTVSFVVMAGAYLVAMFTQPETRWLYIAYICLHSVAMAGINSGDINLIYDYVGGEERAATLGVKNALGGISAFLTALMSGAILGAIQRAGGLRIFGITLYAQQFLSLLSFLAVLFLIFYMRRVIAPLHRLEEKESESLTVSADQK